MPFQIQNFARVSASANEEIDIIQQMNTAVSPAVMYNADVKGCFTKHSYFSSTFTGTNPAVSSGDTQSVIGAPGYFDQISGNLKKYDSIEAYSAVDNFRITYQVVAINATSPKVIVTPTNTTGVVKLLVAPVFTTAVPNGPITGGTLLATPVTVIPAMANAVVSVNSVVFATNAGTAYAGGGNIGLAYDNAVVIVTPNAVPGLIAGAAAATFQPETIAATGLLGALSIAEIGHGVVLSAANPFTAAAPWTGYQPLIVYVNYSVFATV
jgi:hypothetical protein